MKQIRKVLNTFIETAKLLGVFDSDIKNAQQFLEHQEYGLCFDTLVTQMYEYSIEIDDEVYSTIEKIANAMKLSESNYLFMKELMRTKNDLPKAVKEKIASIIASLG